MWFFVGLWLYAAAAAPFRLHIAKEPVTLDPHLQSSSAASYVSQNLFRNLFSYNDKEGLVPDLGTACARKGKLVLVCHLKKNLKWSDGSPLSSRDFLSAYQRILDPKESVPRADMLFKIKNAEAIYKHEKKIDSLGITAPDPLTLRYELAEPDPEFEYSLSNYWLAPIKNKAFAMATAKDLVTSGPYKVRAWVAGEKLVLESNVHYNEGVNSSRPVVEVLFIPEDSVALQVYEQGGLSLLRRLPSLYIPTYKTRTDFLWVPVTRFDYIGFGPALKNLPALREALTDSLNYLEWQKIYSSEGVPGCPGIPKNWTEEELCYKYDLTRAKTSLKKAGKLPTELKLIYSVLGGEDHRRGMEWIQAQWQDHLGLQIQTLAKDNKVFLEELKSGPPDLFRKGASPDRPTCLAALEIFTEKNPENYLRIQDKTFDSLLTKLAAASSVAQKKKACGRAVSYVMNHHWLIPTGPIHFAMLAKPEFTGWNINTLNQLDLAALQAHNKE